MKAMQADMGLWEDIKYVILHSKIAQYAIGFMVAAFVFGIFGTIITAIPVSHEADKKPNTTYEQLNSTPTQPSEGVSINYSEQDANIPEGCVHWHDARKYVGDYAILYGNVVAAEYASESEGSPTFLDVGTSFPNSNRLTLVIWGENRSNFPSPPETMYADKLIGVHGKVYERDGVCYIEVTSPNDMHIEE